MPEQLRPPTRRPRKIPFGKAALGTAPTGPDPNELKPTAPADPNELKPADNGTDASLPPPTQVNEIQSGSSSSATANADNSTPASDADMSSSKKKKKGLKKIIHSISTGTTDQGLRIRCKITGVRGKSAPK